MLLLLPLWRREDPTPPITATLVTLTILLFLLTWPLQMAGQSVVSRNHYQQQARRLVGILLDSSSELPADWRQQVETEREKEPFPSAGLLTLFQQAQTQPSILSSAGRYRWGIDYPLFEGLSRSYVKHPEGMTVFERFGFPAGGPLWPSLLTHQFLHAGWLHLLFNMLFLFAAGHVLEQSLGLWILPLYLTSGVVAALLQAQWGLPAGEIMVGASGAIAGLMGFSLFALPTARIPLFYLSVLMIMPRVKIFEPPLWACVPLWILQQIFMLLMPLKGDLANVGYAAHVSGFFFGAFFGLLYRMAGSPEVRT